jgi:hypothetical protein
MSTTCKFCPEEVIFLSTVGHRRIPFQTTPSEDGTHEESVTPTGYALFVPPAQRGGRNDLFLPHAHVCPGPFKPIR